MNAVASTSTELEPDAPPRMERLVGIGVTWKLVGQIAIQLIRLLTVAALARLLTPGDYGAAAIAIALAMFAPTVADMGMGSALVQAKAAPRVVRSTTFWASIGFGMGLFALIAAVATPVGTFLGDSQITAMVAAGGLTLAIYSVGSASQAMFMRELKFRSIELRNWLALLTGAVVAITAAASGAGPWALVLQQVVYMTCFAGALWWRAGWRPTLEFSVPDFRELSSFAIRIAGGRWARLIELLVLTLVIGKLASVEELGAWTFAMAMVILPLTLIAIPTAEVLFSAHPGVCPGIPDAGRERETDPVYKLLLCVRYLQTRYLAFICIVSVMLGVATLIVVNAVMSGFSTKLKDRLHGILSDVVIDTDRMDGFVKYDDQGRPDLRSRRQAVGLSPDEIIARIKASPRSASKIEAITPTIEVFAILQFNFQRRSGRPSRSRLIGIDPAEPRAGRRVLRIPRPPEGLAEPELRPDARGARAARREQAACATARRRASSRAAAEAARSEPGRDPRAGRERDEGGHAGAEAARRHPGLLARPLPLPQRARAGGRGSRCSKPGDDVIITTVGGQRDSSRSGARSSSPTTCKTEMSEYDQSFVYVPLEQLQAHSRHGRTAAPRSRSSSRTTRRTRSFVTAELRKLFPLAGRAGRDLGGAPGAAPGRHRRRARHPQPAAVHDRRRRGVQHPGDLHDDRVARSTATSAS